MRLIILFLLAAACFAQPAVNYKPTCTDAEASDTYACTITPSFTLVSGLEIKFRPNTSNTGAATLNINSGGAIAIKNPNRGAVDSALETGDLIAGATYTLVYDGTNFLLQGGKFTASGGSGGYTWGVCVGTAPAANTYYNALTGSLSWATTAGSRINVMPHDGTVKSIYTRVTSGTIAGADMVLTLTKNGVDQALVLTIPMGSPVPANYSQATDVPFVAGDYLGLKLVTGGGATIPCVQFRIE